MFRILFLQLTKIPLQKHNKSAHNRKKNRIPVHCTRIMRIVFALKNGQLYNFIGSDLLSKTIWEKKNAWHRRYLCLTISAIFTCRGWRVKCNYDWKLYNYKCSEKLFTASGDFLLWLERNEIKKSAKKGMVILELTSKQIYWCLETVNLPM